MSGSSTTCKRCGKGFTGPSCPFCTVTGVDLEALLNAEEMKLLREDDPHAPVSLVDMVSGKAFSVVTPLCKIGRDLANDIPLAGDRSMSRFHCQIRQNGNDYVIEDCGSRNGTFLNGSPIATARKLQNGDIVSAGVSRYRFSIKSAEELAQELEAKNGPESASQSTEVAASTLAASGAPTSFVTEKEIAEAREALQKLRGTVEQPGVEPPTEASEWLEDIPDQAVTEPAKGAKKATGQQGSETSAPADGAQTESTKQPVVRPIQKPSASPGSLNRESTPKSSKELDLSAEQEGWVDEYVLPELQKLMGEKERLTALLEEIRQDIKQIDRKIAATQGISHALLSASGPELGQACKQVFDALEWNAEASFNNQFEISLKKEPKVEAVVRVVVTQGDPSMKDFEALVNQQAVVWCQSNYEPKGIMVVQVSPDLPPKQRPVLSKEFLENMRRKKICVVQPSQLLAMYRLVLHSGHDKGYFKEMLTSTCGVLPGFLMKPPPQQETSSRPAATA